MHWLYLNYYIYFWLRGLNVEKKSLCRSTKIPSRLRIFLCVSTDARPQALSPSVPGRKLRISFHGELFSVACASLASSATAVLTPGFGSSDIIFSDWRVSTARLSKSTPTARASRGRRSRSRSQGIRIRFCTAEQML